MRAARATASHEDWNQNMPRGRISTCAVEEELRRSRVRLCHDVVHLLRLSEVAGSQGVWISRFRFWI